MEIISCGGSNSGSPDLLVIDKNDPDLGSLETIEKAHYIVAGQKLYLYNRDIDPWGIQDAMTLLGMRIDTVKENKVTITKRASAAKRYDDSKGNLGFYDWRNARLGTRFWMDYPKDSFIDLTNHDHIDMVFNHILQAESSHLPHITIDAKMDEKAQCAGPVLRAKRDEQGAWAGLTGTNMKQEWLDEIESRFKPEFMKFMEVLRLDDTNFKIVSDEKLVTAPNEVKESDYNAVSFNLIMNRPNFDLATYTFSKPVKVSQYTKKEKDV